MKNEIDEALDYAINRFEELIKDGDIDNMPSGVCNLLWDSKIFDNEVIEEIAEIGRWKDLGKVSIKHNVDSGHIWWFHGDLLGCAKARLEVLKLIKNERIQGITNTETAD